MRVAILILKCILLKLESECYENEIMFIFLNVDLHVCNFTENLDAISSCRFPQDDVSHLIIFGVGPIKVDEFNKNSLHINLIKLHPHNTIVNLQSRF